MQAAARGFFPVYLLKTRSRQNVVKNRRPRRLAIVAALIPLVQGCVASDVREPATQTGVPLSAPTALATKTPRSTLGVSDEPNPLRAVAPTIHIGTGVLVGTPPPVIGGSANSTADANGEVGFNFVNVEIRDIVREILGEQLHLGYVIDPKVQGTATVQTGAPLPRDAVLPTLENVLRANGLALVNLNGIYRILPIEDAPRAAGATTGSPLRGGKPGFAIRVLPLKYSSAADLQRVLEPYTPAGGGLQADTTRNILIAAGTPQDLDSFAQLVAVFDADWLAGMSYAIFPLQVEMAKNLAGELEDIFGQGGEAQLAGALRIVPLDRLNAILVISPQPAYLKEAKNWIDRLDAGNDETTPRLFQYYVQNSRATDLAAVLNDVFSSGGGGGSRTAQTTPGSTAVAVGGRSGSQLGGSTGGTSSSAFSSGSAASGSPSPSAQPQPLSTGSAAATPTRTASPTRSTNTNRIPLGGGGAASGGADLETPSVRIVADDKNNALVIYARPRDYRMIESTIKRLDIIPLQVLIEATIADVDLNDTLKYGLQFFLKSGGSTTTTTGGTTPTTSTTRTGFSLLGDPTIAAATGGFSYALAGANVNAVVSALASITDVTVISSPQLMVLDHQTAVLQVGAQVPIPSQQAQSTLVVGGPIVSTIEYRDTGVILTVMPRVNSSGLVTLDITQEVSDIGAANVALSGAPTINQRRITTSVIVQDGATVALGGLITDNLTKGKAGIPILSDIPIVGALFGTKNNTKERHELLVMFTPKVVRNAQDASDKTDELLDRMHSMKPIFGKAR
jgi:general secretion pathway protein D